MSKYNKKGYFILGYILAVTGILFRIYSIIPSITNYPFPIGWSEGGRIFAAYQVYVPIIAGKYLSWPWLDPSRSILDGIVLLIPNSPIWAYRFWVSLLFIIFNFLGALFTVRKAFAYSQAPEKRNNELQLLLILWGMLFLMQGPIYYHVLAGVLPVLWFYDEKHPIRNLIIIILCSMWQGLCRVNWFLMPATIAILLHVLRTPFSLKRIRNYLKWPLVYSVSGGLISFAIYWIYLKVTGHVSVILNPKMDYPFFLYKLWPNTGYRGLLLNIVLLSLPLLLITLYVGWKYIKNVHWIRLVMLIGILGIFFAGSTVVSLRAGGGYDIHNYDSFLLLLLIIGCFFGIDAVYLDKAGQLEIPPLRNYCVLVLLLILPVLIALPNTSIKANQPNAQSKQALQEITNVLQNSTGTNADHPVLFIDQRQLLVFNFIKDDNIYVPYEKIELMEMAMARNEDYKG